MMRSKSVLTPALVAVLVACGSTGESGIGGNNGGSGANNGESSGGAGAETGDGGVNNGAGGTGSGAGGTVSGGGTGATGGGFGDSPPNPRFPGAGDGWSGTPLAPGQGPDTATDCVTPPDLSKPTQVISSGTTCFYGGENPDSPAATAEYMTEVIDGKEMVRVRVTFDPDFVDNSYGANSIGWSPVRGHRYNDLVGSDHAELKLLDGNGDVAMHFKVDYITADASKPCGYGTLGVDGGDGDLIVGDLAHILAVGTSLDRNLNGCGYCLTQDSPATDDNFTPNPMYPNWDFRMVYEIWIDAAAFGDAGFSGVLIESVHASPAKTDPDTITVTPKACPPDWDKPYCPPHLVGEGQACGGSPPGSGGSGGATSTGGSGSVCPPGTVPDLESEGKFCVPE